MNHLEEILSSVVVLGIGGLLCWEGYQALKTGKTKVKVSTITGFWARFVGVLLLLLGVPLSLLGLLIIFLIILA